MDNMLYIKEKNIKYCTTFFTRLKGMMFERENRQNIYCFPNCKQIHTFFMYKNIDVIVTDKQNKIIKIIYDLKPNHIIKKASNAFYIYEFDKGIITNKTYTRVTII